MKEKEDRRWFRMIPLGERNWAAMFVAFLTFLMTTLGAVLLWAMVGPDVDLWVWLTAGVMTVASLLSVLAMVTGDVAWMLLSVIVSRQR